MKANLNYGKIQWAYEDEEFNQPLIPLPIFSPSPIWINGRHHIPLLSDEIFLKLHFNKGAKEYYFKQAYKDWYLKSPHDQIKFRSDHSFLKYIHQQKIKIILQKNDFTLHPYFSQVDAPKQDKMDDFSEEHHFIIKPIKIENRLVKLYVKDEDIIRMMKIPYGRDYDFLELAKRYIALRWEWEKCHAPAPTFLEWIKNLFLRPVFMRGQLGLKLPS
jgi:hypothetical protein